MKGNLNRLPIYELEEELVRELPRTRRLIIEAPTGSGKSTQVPQMLLDNGLATRQRIVILQPRRLAARMLARRVAHERGSRLGAEVGYQVRFDDCSSDSTRIKYETDGIILRQFLSDRVLASVDTLIFDEFHERHLFGDLMLALAMQLQDTTRPDLKVIVMSATLQSVAIEEYLRPCSVLRSEGRMHPVQIDYLRRPVDPRKTPVWDLAAHEFGSQVGGVEDGDTLIFMPGAYEIRRTLEALRRQPACRGFRLFPLYGDLRPEEQDAAVEPCGERKIIVSTNVAETSLTIEGVRLVIDSGLARKASFDPQRGIDTLLIEKISKASAEQRAGRAGRTAPGRCLRLWTEAEHARREAQELPEIRRVDLSETILLLKESGIGDLASFRWLDPPEEKALSRSLQLLADLGALDAQTQQITPVGSRLLAFPVHPRYARMLVAAEFYGCVPSVALMAALTQDRSILLPRQNRDVREARLDLLGGEPQSDLLLLMKAWQYAHGHRYDRAACESLGIHAHGARQVGRLYEQFLSIAEARGLDTYEHEPSEASLGKCVLTGFCDQLARLINPATQRYELVHRRRGTLDRDSVVKNSPLLVASEVHEIQKRGNEVDVQLSLVTAVEREWLQELYADHFSEERVVSYDRATRRVTARCGVRFRDLMIEEKRAEEATDDEAAAILAGQVLDGNLTLKQWNHAVEQWILRVNLLARACPELAVPSIGDDERRDLVTQICYGARGYKDLKDRPVWPVLRAWLAPGQQEVVDTYAPERATLPNGRRPRVTYEQSQAPHIALRIQELYGVEQTVSVAMDRVPLIIHILAPNQRPVQITEDLASFWKTGYPKAKKELQRRYPKHEWR